MAKRSIEILKAEKQKSVSSPKSQLSQSSNTAVFSKTYPGVYDGKSDWLEYYKQFTLISRAHHWSEQEQAAILIGKLRGDALSAISGLDDEECEDLDLITETLHLNFVPTERTLYSNLLKQRWQADDEPLETVYRDIQKWVKRAYPSADKSTSSAIAIEYFIDAIQDSCVRLHLRQRQPHTLIEALTMARELETAQKVEKLECKHLFLLLVRLRQNM